MDLTINLDKEFNLENENESDIIITTEKQLDSVIVNDPNDVQNIRSHEQLNLT